LAAIFLAQPGQCISGTVIVVGAWSAAHRALPRTSVVTTTTLAHSLLLCITHPPFGTTIRRASAARRSLLHVRARVRNLLGMLRGGRAKIVHAGRAEKLVRRCPLFPASFCRSDQSPARPPRPPCSSPSPRSSPGRCPCGHFPP